MSIWPASTAESIGSPAPDFAADVRAGLRRVGQKTIPPKYLYDDLGSLLFDAITRLPEYGVWRAELQLLEANADAIATSAAPTLVVELGSGSAEKTRPVLRALLARTPVTYCPVEISTGALDISRRGLADLESLTIRPFARDYLAGLEEALTHRSTGARALVLFLGSSLGNFEDADAQRFLQRVRRTMLPGDSLLLGADLDKPEARLLAAYDDALGVTAAFNMNLLVRMNRELGADFDLAEFRHRARIDPVRRNVEMHIESRRDQIVAIAGDGFSVSFRRGETIHTEISHKYSLTELDALTQRAGFRLARRWLDTDYAFASGLYVAG